jgi:large subunit ribosomal protein L29
VKSSELRKKNRDELNAELISLKRAQFSLRVQAATQQLTNNSEIKKTRREIARVKTILNEGRS